MTAATAVAALTLLAGAAVQSGLGFGFAIVAAPVLAATDGPATAAPTLAICSLVLSSLVLLAERRTPDVLTGSAARLVGWALPGMAAGALVLAHVPARPLSVLVAAAVLVAIALHARGDGAAAGDGEAARGHGEAARGDGARGRRGGSGALAGLTSGLLATSTGLSGPPAVLHLIGRGATPGQLRDTLAVAFVSMSALSLVAFALTGTLRLASAPLLLVAASVAGWALGRLLFARVQAIHRPLSLAVLAFGATAALVQALV